MDATISIIAAIGKNRELGLKNRLLWHIPRDMDHFKKLTTGHVVIMGRKTFESIGKPLPKRMNIVISRNPVVNAHCAFSSATGGEFQITNSLEEAISLGSKLEKNGEIFIIGGASIYAQAMPFADKLYLTLVDATSTDADAFFPDYSEFKKVISQEDHEENGLKFTFLELSK